MANSVFFLNHHASTQQMHLDPPFWNHAVLQAAHAPTARRCAPKPNRQMFCSNGAEVCRCPCTTCFWKHLICKGILCEGPKNGRAQNLSIQVAAAWSFLELKQEAVGAKKQQGSSANSPKPEHARAQTPCAKPSPLPSSRRLTSKSDRYNSPKPRLCRKKERGKKKEKCEHDRMRSVQHSVCDAQESCHDIVRRQRQRNPHPSETLFGFSHHSIPVVQCSGLIPWMSIKILSNTFAKSLAGGCCAHCRTIVCSIFCNIFHWLDVLNLLDFHARCSLLCILAMSIRNRFLTERSAQLKIQICNVSVCCGHLSTQHQTIFLSYAHPGAAGI